VPDSGETILKEFGEEEKEALEILLDRCTILSLNSKKEVNKKLLNG